MHPSIRIFAAAAFVAAALWSIVAIDSLVRHDPEDYRNALLLLPWLLTMAALTGIHLTQHHRSGRLERVGYRVVIGGMSLTAVGLAGYVGGIEEMAFVEVAGMVPFILGMIAFGVGTYRAGVFPKHVGIAIALTQPLTMAMGVALSPIAGLHDHGSYTGAIVHGAVLATVGLALFRLRRPVRHTPRVVGLGSTGARAGR